MPLGLFALAMAAFAIGTTEFVIVGLIPEMARDLSVSLPTTGLLVSLYALAITLIAGAVVAVVIVGVILGQLEYNTWTAAAGSTIWCKFFLDFALSRQAHGLAKGKQATPKT